VQPVALVLLAPAAPYGIPSISLTNYNAGIFMHYIRNGAFWRNGYKPDFARARRYVFRGGPVYRHRSLYEGLVHESGRAIFEIALWPLVSGGKDWLTPASVVRKLARLHPQAAHRPYPGRGHWVIDDEDTDEKVHSICGWLRPIEQKQERSGHG
jgi:pimeloyl-ACP methyl ester carboxylesterase